MKAMMRSLVYNWLCFVLLICGIGVPWAAEPGNPWLRAATQWPAVLPAAITPPAGAEEHFRQMVQGNPRTYELLLPAWQPEEHATLAYYSGWGFLYTRQTAAGTIRVREVRIPLYPGSRYLRDGLVVEARVGAVKMPVSRAQLERHIARVTGNTLLSRPSGVEYAQPHLSLGSDYAEYLSPNNLAAWTDSSRLLLARYDDPQYAIPLAVRTFLAEKSPPIRDALPAYPLARAMSNPWLILAARHWPVEPSACIQPPPGAAAHFFHWVEGALRASWRPEDIDAVLYDPTAGFFFTTDTADYRVRVREVTQLAPRVADLDRAVTIAITRKQGVFPKPTTVMAMESLLAPFLTADVLALPACDQCPPSLFPLAGGEHYARYRREGTLVGDLPITLFAWTDGHILLIALYEDMPDPCPSCTLAR